MQTVTCSIDKVTSMINIVDTDKFSKFVALNPYFKDVVRSFSKGDFDTNIRCTDGTFIQLNSNKKVVSVHGTENCRITFNPNVILAKETLNKLQEVLSFMKYPRFSQLHYSIDYHGYNLSSLYITPPTALKSEKYYSRSGELESVVLGTGNGTKRYVLYDKKKESNLPTTSPDWWRLEVQRRRFKDESDYFTNPFNKLKCTLPNTFPDDIRIQDKIMLEGLQNNPDMWGELQRKSRKSYDRLRKINAQFCELTPHPKEVFEENITSLKNQLENIFLPCHYNQKVVLCKTEKRLFI